MLVVVVIVPLPVDNGCCFALVLVGFSLALVAVGVILVLVGVVMLGASSGRGHNKV